MTRLLLGLDVGTTAVKAAVLDERGAELAHARARTPWRAVPTGAELDPAALLEAARAAAAAAIAAGPGGRVAAIGVASMAETGVLLDAHGSPVVPAIAWHDRRGADEARRLADELPSFAARTGLPPTSLCTLAKYAWMRAHWPDARRAVRWLNVAEWVVRGLGGEEAAELSLASRTGFLDLYARRAWDEALAWAAAPPGLTPEPVAAGTPMGRTPDGAVLTVGGHDHLAAAVGADAARRGDVLDSCGTAEAFVRAAGPLAPEAVAPLVRDGITVGWHAADDRHALLGAVWSGSALQAALDLVGVPSDARAELEQAALETDPRALALDGFGLDGFAIRGVRPGVSPAALYRAVLERAGHEGAAVLARMEAHAGPRRRLVVTGGWAAGEAARAIKARHLGAFGHSPAISTGARGAALAAGRAAGLWSIDDAPHPERGELQEVS